MRKGSAFNLSVEGFKQEDVANNIAQLWSKLVLQKSVAMGELRETRQYIFATSTKDTSAGSLPWKNSTTTPKLCQIRDNLHSNYLSSLFPNDKWITWEALDSESDNKQKAEQIQKYMANKCKMTNFRSTVSSLLYDYIDCGTAFATRDFISSFKTDPRTNEKSKAYVGPKAIRISPEDIVFDATAPDFESAYKIIRSTLTLGELSRLSSESPEHSQLYKAVKKAKDVRKKVMSIGSEDLNKQVSIAIDGYGDFYEYLTSGYVEVLTFYGDLYDGEELLENQKVVVIDRMYVASMDVIETYSGRAPIFYTTWRKRADNLWGMGPLANLVGMQYRLDHLENAKADAFDLVIHPPLKIIGDVEAFTWGPSAEVHLDENGDVQEIAKGVQGILIAGSEMQTIMNLMEEMAGSPREAMGMRSPGEKTAFEVSELMTAAGRIFQEKVMNFELELLEPLLNSMYEVSMQNFDGVDVVKILNAEIGIDVFRELTKDDVLANGILRPIGARNFAQKAQDLNNLLGVFNSPLYPIMEPHINSEGLMDFVTDVVNIRNYSIFKKNAGVQDRAETEEAMALAQGDVAANLMDQAEGDV